MGTTLLWWGYRRFGCGWRRLEVLGRGGAVGGYAAYDEDFHPVLG